MEEPKRLQFTTVGPSGKEDKPKQPQMTHRFELDLAESTETTCPEFFYSDLLKTATGRKEKTSTEDDPFGDDEDAEKMAAIARAFEEKYNKPEMKKKRKKKWQKNLDHYMEELGDGYDETDTFIDNSEAYDEVLPGQLSTKLGGFYINSGKLDFKEVSDDSEDDFRPVKVGKKKRRISSDEDSGEEVKVVKKKKLKDSLSVDGEIRKKKKKKLVPPNGEKPFKKPKQPQDKEKPKQNKPSTVAALIKSSSPNLNGEVENGISSPTENGNNSDDDVPHIKSNISMTIDAVVAMAVEDDSNSQDGDDSKKGGDTESVPKLPETMPDGMLEKIAELKTHAKESREGKSKFFTASVNKLLLDVEVLSKQISVGNRSSMYSHLAAFLPVNKHTLLKRAKTLSLKEQEDRMKEPMDKLRQAVNKMMPALFQAFEAECQKSRQEEGTTEEEGGKEETGGKEDRGSDSDDESKTNQPEATKKRQFGPRKKFVWDSNVRSLLCDVVRVKMQLFQVSKGRSQAAEEYCKAFLDGEVKPIWPKGWMQTRMLYKESRIAHAQWTNPPKTKKSLPVSKTPGTTTPTTNQAVKTSLASSAPAGINGTKVAVVSVQKLTTVGSLSERPSVVYAKSSCQAITPSVPSKKIVPTVLDYAGRDTSSADTLQNSASNSKPVLVNTPTATVSHTHIKSSEAKVSNSGQKQTEKSWGHIVSDILRSSFPEQPAKTSITPSQRQVTSSSQQSSSYIAQFSNFLNQGLADKKKLLPEPVSPTSVSKMSAAQQQMLLEKQAKQIEKHNQALKLLEEQRKAFDQRQHIDHKSPAQIRDQVKQIEMKLNLEKQKALDQLSPAHQQQRMKEKVIEKQIEMQAQEIEKHNQQLKLLQEKNKALDRQQHTDQQLTTKQLSDILRGDIKLQQNTSSSNASNQQKLSTSASSNSSPMLFSVSNTNAAALPGKSSTPKQIASLFNPNTKTNVSLETVIRKQLNEKRPSAPVVHKAGGQQVHQGPISRGQSGDLYGLVSSSTDILRKSSPQSQAVAAMIKNQVNMAASGVSHSVKMNPQPSQVKVSAPQVKASLLQVKVSAPQVKVSQGRAQGQVTFNTPSSNSVSSTGNNKLATSLLQSFVGQAQSSSQKYPSIPDLVTQQRLPKPAHSSPLPSPGAVGQPTQWSPSAQKHSQPQGQPTYQGARDGSQPHKSHATSLPVPGYQSVKLSQLSGFGTEQMAAAAYQSAQKQHQSPERGVHSNPMLPRKSPGPRAPQINPDLHHYNNLQYSYHGYQDNS